MLTVLVVLLGLSICTSASVVGVALVGWMFGARIKEISLFYGPVIYKRQIGDTRIEIRAVPFFGELSFQDEYLNFHSVIKIIVNLGGPLIILIIAAIMLGLSTGLHAFLTAIPQVFLGAFYPKARGSLYIHSLREFVQNNSVGSDIGLIASKMAAITLLPFPGFVGCTIFFGLIRLVRPVSVIVIERLMQCSFLVFLALVACWAIGLFFYLFPSAR